MKNTQFKINILTKNGIIQSFKKRKDGWVLISSKGNIFDATAEQVLNHLLPVLAKKKKGVTLEVKFLKRPA